jgi:protease-4
MVGTWNRSRRLCFVSALALLPGCVFITGNLNPFASTPRALEEHVVSGSGRDKILLLDVSRVIASQEAEGAFGITRRESTTARVRQELEQAGQDDRVRAVVLRINSPGGTVTASDTIFHQIVSFKTDHHIPVIAHLLDMATSGAYYVALAADEIIASPTTVTGSIGVVMYGVNVTGLLEKIGVANQTLKAGAHKDIGSPLRKMTPEEAVILQDVLEQMQRRFLSVVQERRPRLTPEMLPAISDGRVFTADQALQTGLIDNIGYLEDAIQVARGRAGLSEARVVLYRRPEEFAENIYSRPSLGPVEMNLINFNFAGLGRVTPQFMYLWLPNAE